MSEIWRDKYQASLKEFDAPDDPKIMAGFAMGWNAAIEYEKGRIAEMAAKMAGVLMGGGQS